MSADNYPAWVCRPCGTKYSRRSYSIGSVSVTTTAGNLATWHEGTCDVCGQHKPVTEPRDFGHLRDEWVTESEANKQIMREQIKAHGGERGNG